MTALAEETTVGRTQDWFPSRWGPDDQAGALNEITPATILEAVRLVRTGTIYDLAHVLHADVPAFPGRTFRQYLTTNAHAVNRRGERSGGEGLGRNNVNWVVEQITATQQMGTHLDGLNHLQVGERTYNGHRIGDIAEEWGTNRLGIDTLPQVVTRGLLVDVAAARRTNRLAAGDVITVDDVRSWLAMHGLQIRRGDAVLFHTGWGQLWDEHPDEYGAGEPGPGVELAGWLASHGVALTGCDTWSYGPYPAEDPDEPFVVPQTLNVRHGVVVAENLALAELAAAEIREFLLVVSHAKLRAPPVRGSPHSPSSDQRGTDMNDHYDVIVIGSGAGGGTLAYALAPTGKKVLILERGDYLPREPENWDPASIWLDNRYHNSGEWTDLDTGKSFKPKQNYYVGGNTKFYGAILFRMRERDFQRVQHVDGASPAWPISYADLEPWYTRAERLYRVHGTRGTDPTEPWASAPLPYPAISHEPRIAQLHDDLKAIGLNPFDLPNGILIDEVSPQTSACIRCATCDGYPCLVNGKADAHVICVEPALSHPNVTMLYGCVRLAAADGPLRADGHRSRGRA